MPTATNHDKRERELFWLKFAVAVAVFAFLVTTYGVYDQHQSAVSAQANADRLTQALESTQADLSKVQAENDALTTVSLPGFLQKYDAHIAELKKASDKFEKAKTAKGVNISGSDAAGALTHAEKELIAACDKFTDYVDRWRVVSKSVDNLLDGNVTQLENARRENNSEGVSAMANRIINAAPDLATPLRAALDNLKPTSKDNKDGKK